MSIPNNHHFVSQVHIRNFFNDTENKIFVYDKVRTNLYSKTTAKSLFSERGLNSKFANGIIDHSSLEKELNNLFEKDFSRHTKTIQQFVEHRELTEEVQLALKYLARYGVISDMRSPRHKKYIDDGFSDALNQLMQNATPEFNSRYGQLLEYRNHVNYSNAVSYSEVAEKILESFGEAIFKINIPESEEDFFLLPDFAATTERAKINHYFNPDVEEIAFIGIPLTSKIYIQFFSRKLFKSEGLPSSSISFLSTSDITFYNIAALANCQDKVACESENYLRNFIKSL